MRAVAQVARALANILSPSLEATQAELEALEDEEPNELFEHDPIRSPKKKTKRAANNAKPRDERGRFAPKKKK